MKLHKLLAMTLLGAGLVACAEDSPVTDRTNQAPETVFENPVGSFARGADVSWLTQMEREGLTFYSPDRVQKECMELLRDDCGVNAIRLRVWVNPAQGWNNAGDVIVKARRAWNLGMRVMIDFHFSDTWADPGNQVVPAAWADYDIEQLKQAVAAHVKEVLVPLKEMGITPEWVQIGNETRNGMMYPLGNIGDYPANFAALVTTGTQAVKEVFPEALAIVHVDQGQTWTRYTHVFDVLKARGAEYDMIGISVYPEPASWRTTIDSAVANMIKATETYGKPCMVCEIGMDAEEVAAATAMMDYITEKCEAGAAKGVFYWEPQAPLGYNGGYRKGCFLDNAPTTALTNWKK